MSIDGLVCRLPARRVHVGLPFTLGIWMAFGVVVTAVLSVPAASWPAGTQAIVGGLVGALGIAGALPLWMFLQSEMLGSSDRILRANHLGMEVVSKRAAGSAMWSRRARRSDGYQFARWSGTQAVAEHDGQIFLQMAAGRSVAVNVQGLARDERTWLGARLAELAASQPHEGAIPEELKRLSGAAVPSVERR